MNRIKKILGGLLRGYTYVAGAILLTLVVVVLILFLSGMLAPDRLERARLALQGIEPKAPEVPPMIPQEEWAKIKAARRSQHESFSKRQAAAEKLSAASAGELGRIRREREKLEELRAALQTESSALDKRKVEQEGLAGDKNFKKILKIYQSMNSKDVVQQWLTLSNGEIVRFLRKMRDDAAASALQTMGKTAAYTTPTDPRDLQSPTRLQVITELLQKS